jgi:hypothetical protein
MTGETDMGTRNRKWASRRHTLTIYLGPERKERIEQLQDLWNLNGSQVVRLLIDHALADVDTGRLAPERETITRVKPPSP